jgi:hypothetical protein
MNKKDYPITSQNEKTTNKLNLNSRVGNLESSVFEVRNMVKQMVDQFLEQKRNSSNVKKLIPLRKKKILSTEI